MPLSCDTFFFPFISTAAPEFKSNAGQLKWNSHINSHYNKLKKWFKKDTKLQIQIPWILKLDDFTERKTEHTATTPRESSWNPITPRPINYLLREWINRSGLRVCECACVCPMSCLTEWPLYSTADWKHYTASGMEWMAPLYSFLWEIYRERQSHLNLL